MNKHLSTKLLGFSVLIGIATAAYAADTSYFSDTDLNLGSAAMDQWMNVDIDPGGKATRRMANERNWVFTTDTANGARAELRRDTTVNTAGTQSESIEGSFALSSADIGARVSIIQLLNIDNVGDTGGAATPAAQLIIRNIGGIWRFYVNQDQSSPCTSYSITPGERVKVRMVYTEGQRPRFFITKGGVQESCQPVGGSTRVVGEGGRSFYGKLGGYTTSTGPGNSAVSWNGVAD